MPSTFITVGLRDQFSKGMRRLRMSVKGLWSDLFSLKTALGGLAGGLFLKGLLGASDSVESLGRAFKAASGGMAEGRAEMGFVRDVAEDLGMVFKDTAESYMGVLAAAEKTNLEGQAVRDIFTGIAIGARGMNMTSANTNRVLRATAQIMSKGKVQAEELRLQMGDVLPGAFQIAARAMNMTTEELDDALDKGELYADVFLPRFAEELRRTFGGAAAEASDRLRANLARVRTSLFDLERTAGDPFLEGVNEGLKDVNTMLKDPEMAKAARELGVALGDMAVKVASLADDGARFAGGVNRAAEALGKLPPEVLGALAGAAGGGLAAGRWGALGGAAFGAGMGLGYRQDMERQREALFARAQARDEAILRGGATLGTVLPEGALAGEYNALRRKGSISSSGGGAEQQDRLDKAFHEQRMARLKEEFAQLNEGQKILRENLDERVALQEEFGEAWRRQVDGETSFAISAVQEQKRVWIEAGVDKTKAEAWAAAEIKKIWEPVLEEQLRASDDLVAGWSSGMDRIQSEVASGFEVMEGLAVETSQAMAGAFEDFFYDAVTGRVSDLTDYVRQAALAMLRYVASVTGQQLSAGLMSSLSGLFSASSGSMTSSQRSQMLANYTATGSMARAGGGGVWAGGVYLVGEDGPELLRMSMPGRVVSAGQTQRTLASAVSEVHLGLELKNESGTPLQATTGTPRMDGERIVVPVLLSALRRDATVRRQFKELVLKG